MLAEGKGISLHHRVKAAQTCLFLALRCNRLILRAVPGVLFLGEQNRCLLIRK